MAAQRECGRVWRNGRVLPPGEETDLPRRVSDFIIIPHKNIFFQWPLCPCFFALWVEGGKSVKAAGEQE
jgi:hypothetical protein